MAAPPPSPCIPNSTTTVAKVEELTSAEASWSFQSWSRCHGLLAANSECIVQVGRDVEVRFFLKTVEKRWQADTGRTLINKWYALYARLVGSHETVCLTVDIAVSTGSYKTGIPVVLKSGFDETSGGATLVVEEFLLIDKSIINFMSGITCRNEDSPRRLDVLEEELVIHLKVTLFQYSQQIFSNEVCSSSHSLASTPEEMFGEKSNTSVISEEMHARNFFCDAKLMMADQVALYAHRSILSNAIPTFDEKFHPGNQHFAMTEYQIQDITSQVMKHILEFIYTGRTNLSCAENISEVVRAASEYQLQDLVEHCNGIILK